MLKKTSLNIIPLTVVAFIFYNLMVLVLGQDMLSTPLWPDITMRSGAVWSTIWADAIVLLTFIMLFCEIGRTPGTVASSLMDRGLAILVFVVCVMEFVLVPMAATSTFFMIVLAALIDVVAGYTNWQSREAA